MIFPNYVGHSMLGQLKIIFICRWH